MDCAKRDAQRAREIAEEERYQLLSLEEKVEVNRALFTQQLEAGTILALQLDHMKFGNRMRAQCRARECLDVHTEGSTGREINDQFGILIIAKDERRPWYTTKRYFHIHCVTSLTNLLDLLSTSFDYAGEPNDWGSWCASGSSTKGALIWPGSCQMYSS